MAVSWVWAPAIFICSLQSYQNGIAGAFWFIVPNILCFFLFIPIILKFREKFSSAYTIANLFSEKLPKEKSLHLTVTIVSILIQISAIVINATAGGTLFSMLTGMNYSVAVTAVVLIALSYSLPNGFKASVKTDQIQMSLLLLVAFIIVPWALINTGGTENLIAGLAGASGNHSSILDSEVFWAFGLSSTITLLVFPASDQMFFQRALAIPQKDIRKTFLSAGLLFGLVPTSLCLLGFMAASPSLAITVNDPQMVGGRMLLLNFSPTGQLYFLH